VRFIPVAVNVLSIDERDIVRRTDADTLLRLVRAAAPAAAAVVNATRDEQDDEVGQADRIVRHWRNELAPLAALPGVGGRFADPVRGVLAAAVQALLVLSLAQMCGIDDERAQVRLIAHAVLRSDLPADWPAPPPPAEPAEAKPPDGGDPSPGDGDPSPAGREAWQRITRRATIARRATSAVVALAREMWAVQRMAGQRAEGRPWHRAVGSLPAVGVVGTTLGERQAVTEVATRAYAALGLPTDQAAA
jgi:hypothetical protein